MIRRRSMIALAAAMGLGLGLGWSGAAEAAEMTVAQSHMGHVMQGWSDTPDGRGLLPTAFGEAKVAEQHVGLALKAPDNLGSIQTHLHHVLHALDPSMESNGPGLGYGLIKAVEGASKHAGFAAGSDDATANVKTHTEHVTTALNNAVAAAREAQAAAQAGLAAESASDAAAAAERVQALIATVIGGKDANGDGSVSWQEGGLEQARQHMGFMYKGEGLEIPAN